VTLAPALSGLASSLPPWLLFAFALLRTLFVPLYRLCNLHGAGAVVRSDAFYLGGVQLGFGTTNGWLGSQCMMSAAQWVDADEREAAGAFMGLMLVAGLTAGSLLSFFVAGA
jgi:equilibrative nucleoside transporter 1/2/3